MPTPRLVERLADCCYSALVSEPEQCVPQHARLQAADLKRLSVRERHLVIAARHRADPLDLIDGGERAAAEPDELARVELRFKACSR